MLGSVLKGEKGFLLGRFMHWEVLDEGKAVDERVLEVDLVLGSFQELVIVPVD